MTIPPVVARIFSGDSTSPLTRDGHGCPKLNAQSFARMRNQQSVHMARMWCKARDSAVWEGWWSDNPSGSPRIFSGDSTSPLTRDGHGCPKLNAQSFARMRNQQSVHMARMWCKARDSEVLEGYAGREVCDNNIKKRSQLATVTAYLLYGFI